MVLNILRDRQTDKQRARKRRRVHVAQGVDRENRRSGERYSG